MIIDNATPADGEGAPPHPDDREGSNAATVLGHVLVEGEGGEPQPSPFSSYVLGEDPAGRAAAATTLELLQAELLHRLFPGISPQMPSSQIEGASSSDTTTTNSKVQLQQSVVMLMDEGVLDDSAAMYCTAFQAPPSVIGVGPAAVYCQPPPLSPLALPQDKAASLKCSGGRWITVWLQLSAPLPSEGVSLLARHRGAILAARLEQADGQHDALIIKVRVL